MNYIEMANYLEGVARAIRLAGDAFYQSDNVRGVMAEMSLKTRQRLREYEKHVITKGGNYDVIA